MNKRLPDNGWLKIVHYINSYKIGEILKRQILLKKIEGVRDSTIDNYRNMLRSINILETVKPGNYKLLQKIPKDLNIKILLDLIDEQKKTPSRQWFMPIQDRVDRILNQK